MSLADDLQDLKQTKDYQESGTDGVQNDILAEGSSDVKESKSKREAPPVNFKIIGKIAAGIVGVIMIVALVMILSKPKAPDWTDEVDNTGFVEEPTFSYSEDEKALLRSNGYTGDEIEEYEFNERDALELVAEAEAKRKEVMDAEIGPYLNGGTEEFKRLQELTWVGGKEVDDNIVTNNQSYKLKVGTFNCDYFKIPAYGSQLFIKCYLKDYNQPVFMSVTPERYSKLDEKGNIVIIVEFNEYPGRKICVTNVYEKNIKK